MNRTCSESLDADPSDRSADAEVFLRQEPDVEEEDDEEDEDDRKQDAEDDNQGDDGYSE
jgi:hypothetical protein